MTVVAVFAAVGTVQVVVVVAVPWRVAARLPTRTELAIAQVDATVTVSTFDGEFMPEIPITLERFRGGNEMTFTLGRGGARLTLNAFDGDIVLRQR